MFSLMRLADTRWLVCLVVLLAFCMPAFSQDGFISAKNFADAQGIAYQWFPIQKMLVMRKGLNSLKLTVNETAAIMNDKKVYLPAAPRIQDGQIMVPATAIIKIFQGDTEAFSAPPKTASKPVKPAVAPKPANNTANLNTSPPIIKPPANTIGQAKADAILVALRHSVRDDHTRVVLEFNETITYTTETKDNVYRLSIKGCRNLVPTRRTNPVGRDIKKMDINSGPNRSGLILTFTMAQNKRMPEIETVNDPFRMIVSFFSSTEPEVATSTIAANQAKPEEKPEEKPVVKVVPQEKAPEINIEVEPAILENENFKSRTIVIDPGHGGNDSGYTFPGRIPEKEITLSVAQHLAQSLEKAGLKAVLLRNRDVEMSQSQRVSIANRHGADLFISLHTGGSSDPDKSGVACMIYSKSGTHVPESETILTEGLVYKNWLESTRFDLASFLARRINTRLKDQLKVESRGVKQLPLLPLKFIVNPAVLVEVGMLSEKTEGKNLLSKNYHQAIGACIANGIVDFFNGIVINKP